MYENKGNVNKMLLKTVTMLEKAIIMKNRDKIVKLNKTILSKFLIVS